MKRWIWLASTLLALAGCDETPATGVDAGTEDAGPAVDGATTPDGGCETQIAVLCDGTDLVARDICTDAGTVIEACTGACHRGACVDCAPGAGRLCIDGAVHEVDSCATVGEVIETCADECRAGACLGAECTPGASTTCVGDTVYSEDSCGNLENALTVCAAGCAAGACEGCALEGSAICFDGDVYEYDSCGVARDLLEDCAETCQNTAAGISCGTGLTCTPNEGGVTCLAGDLHHVDSCGNVQTDIAQDCPSGCDNTTGCLACVPVRMGTTCAGGNSHELIGGCPGTAPAAGALLDTCTSGCRDGACLTGGECIPEVGTVCSGGNVHTIDSCGAIGPLDQACPAGCDRGACTAATDAGMPDAGTDAGTDAGGSSCTCTVVVDGYPPFDCMVGSNRCGGCLGYDDFCDDETACTSACPSEFVCVGNAVVLDGVTIETCTSPTTLCGLVCGS